MPVRTKTASVQTSKGRAWTTEDFMAEYETGTRKDLNVDPRIDMTKPIYEQAMKLMAKDKAAEQERPGENNRRQHE